MAEALLFVMLVAATLYAVLGGADFGVGIVEPLLGPRYRRAVEAAILPVWEANHVWLVLVVVLAFVGFPGLFVTVATYLHIPLLGLLLGVVARGSAFTFRHYDPAASGALHGWYSWIFRFGSPLAPLCLGMIVAACVQGGLETDASRGAYALFVAPWNTAFCWAAGAFACLLFAFEGAALLAAEHASGGPLPLLRLTRRLHAAAIAGGAVVFWCAYVEGVPWFRRLWREPLGWGSLLLASALIPVIAHAFQRGKPWLLRCAAGGQVACVLLGLFGAEYPVLLRLRGGGALDVAAAAAPPATLRALALAVGLGLLLIVPALAYLLRVYKLSSR
jgi:cytochrome d ubiquinol oxidase subunit II